MKIEFPKRAGYMRDCWSTREFSLCMVTLFQFIEKLKLLQAKGSSNLKVVVSNIMLVGAPLYCNLPESYARPFLYIFTIFSRFRKISNKQLNVFFLLQQAYSQQRQVKIYSLVGILIVAVLKVIATDRKKTTSQNANYSKCVQSLQSQKYIGYVTCIFANYSF